MKTMPLQGRYTIRRSIRSPRTLRHEMQRVGMTGVNTAHVIGVSQPSMSRMMNGKQDIQLEDAAKIVEQAQDAFLALDMAHQFVHVTAPVINGDGIVKEPLAMAIRLVPEMQQAIEAVQNSFDELTTPAEKVKDTSEPLNAVNQLLDALLYGSNAAAFICEEFGWSMQSMMTERVKDWKRQGIVGD